jgi:predicted site-specific integrase-resolvase
VLVGEEILEQWQKRGLIRAIPLPSGVRRICGEEVATLRAGRFTGYAALREDDDVVAVEPAPPIE